MKILIALTYYRPHYSGLTIYAERLARALVAQGHQVFVLTSRYDPALAPFEAREGVQVIRLPVLARVSKGVIMPSMLWEAWKLIRQVDVVHLHVPQLDAAPLSLLSRLMGKPVVLTYHCDLRLPSGIVHAIANRVSNLANHISARAASVIVTNTLDYAQHSNFLQQYFHKVRAIYPPVELAPVKGPDLDAFRRKAGIEAGQHIIGMAARLASEKGVEYLVQAMPQVLARYPTARVLFVGQYEDVLGEEVYAKKLSPLIERLGEHWKFLGILDPVDFAAFFHVADVTVLPSINSTESFGMVQVEAMTCGAPVVASDLPGVREPVRLSGMGKVVPVAEADRLAQAIMEILDAPERFRGNPVELKSQFSPETIAQEYLKIFSEVVRSQAPSQDEQASKTISSCSS